MQTMKLTRLIITAIVLQTHWVVAQTDSSDLMERTVERLSEVSTAPVDFSDITELPGTTRDHTWNINRAGREELEGLPFLTGRQIRNLYLYLQAYGTVYSIYELMAIDGFDSATVIRIKPFIRIGPEPEKHPLHPGGMIRYGRSQLVLRYEQVLQKQQGYGVPDSVRIQKPDAGYLGSPARLWFRYTWSYYDRLTIGISGEKDPGEQFFKGNQKNGMDFYSGFISLQNTGILRQLTLGNFNAVFGQGLTLGSGLSSGAIPGTGNLRRYAGGIRPSQSVNEVNYLRGIAAVLRKGKFRFSGFWSSHKRDANMTPVDSVSGGTDYFSSFSGTGYHRMPKEISERNALRENLFGGNLTFRNSFLSLGFTAIKSHWSAILNPETHTYSRFVYHGNDNLGLGIDYQVLWKDIYFFGEVSRSKNGGMAFLSGIQANPDPRLQFSLLVRDYRPEYQNLLSNASGQNSSNANEEGILLSATASVSSFLGLSGYIDIFRFPWLKYRNDNPSAGKEFQVQSDMVVRNSARMYFRIRIRSGQINDPGNTGIVNLPAEVHRITLRYQASWQITPATLLRSRFEWLRSQTGGDKPRTGSLISQELSCKLPSPHLSVGFLYALFDTDSYNERIYAYEADVPYGYSVPAYAGKGIRCLLLTGWHPVRFLDLWIRYAHTWYSDRNVIGTGLEQISGDTRSELEIQVRLRF
jgi:hypothetical protein